MRSFHHWLILALLLAGTVVCLRNQSTILRSRAQVARQEQHLSSLADQTSALRAELTQLEANLRNDTARKNTAASLLSQETTALAKKDPEALWAQPPATLPDWTAESPVIWVPKELLTHVELRPFTSTGELDPAAANILGIDSPTVAEVNRTMRELLQEYRSLEYSSVKLSTNHLPGISGSAGVKHTIQLETPPDAGAQIKERLVTILTSTLGQQRSAIILDRAQPWFAKQLGGFAVEPKIISVAWRPKNGYSVAIRGPGQWTSFGGLKTLTGHIPDHLLHHFAHLQQPESTE